MHTCIHITDYMTCCLREWEINVYHLTCIICHRRKEVDRHWLIVVDEATKIPLVTVCISDSYKAELYRCLFVRACAFVSRCPCPYR